MAGKKKKRRLIGRLERVDFPDLALSGVVAKIDTGAFSSALHCHDISESEDGKKLYFKLLDPTHPAYNELQLVSSNFTRARVRSSTGRTQKRYKIRIRIAIGPKTYKAQFTLTDRSKMKYPVLLGRTVLAKRFIVDVDQQYVLDEENE